MLSEHIQYFRFLFTEVQIPTGKAKKMRTALQLDEEYSEALSDLVITQHFVNAPGNCFQTLGIVVV